MGLGRVTNAPVPECQSASVWFFGMKFGDKYELLQSVADGPVETFVAKDLRRGEDVLVHILDCGEQKPNQPTVQWVMEAFRRVAPEPAALVLEAGRYSGTLYAYLVTRMPEEGALKNWVKVYKAQMLETQEVESPVSKAPVSIGKDASNSPTADLPPVAPAPPAGAFTQAFKGFGMQAGSLPQADASPDLETPPPVSSRSGEQPLSRVEPYRYNNEPQPAEELSTPTDLFKSDFKAAKLPAQEFGPVVKELSPKPGEFTNFWQGPFVGGQASEIPALSEQPSAPPRKVIGEFTATFGPMMKSPEELASSPAGSGGFSDEPGGFTKAFDLDRPDRDRSSFNPPNLDRANLDRPAKATESLDPKPMGSFGTLGVMSGTVGEPARESFLAPSLPSSPLPLAPPIPIPAIPEAAGRPPAVPAVTGSSDGLTHGATQVFRMPSAKPEVSEPAFASGPGEYTRIISAVRSQPTEAETSTSEESASGAKAGMAIPSASLPKLPAMAPPPLPAAPAPPAMKKPAAPAVPKPKLDAVKPPKPPMSYWPLIIALAVLFVAAALLVVYFVIKH
ncbi:MAG: hypothetical protein ABSA78_01265 [Candidatus Sulfotelmatobacter sp.]